MSKFKKGETSKSVLDKKNKISNSMNIKIQILNSIKSINDIPSSLEIKNKKISQAAVHAWSDENLNIIGYSRNSAHAEHNADLQKKLLESIDNANKRISSLDFNYKDNQKSKNELLIESLKIENNDLKNALAEVYRAYMQLISQHKEDGEISEAYRKIILRQSEILGKNRVWEIK